MTGVDPKTQIRKTPTGCRGFLLFKLDLVIYQEYELKSLLDQSDNDNPVPSYIKIISIEISRFFINLGYIA